MILAGNGHCHDSAIVNRIKRRGIADVVSVRTVIDDGQGGVAEALAKPMNDFLVVLDMPDRSEEAAARAEQRRVAQRGSAEPGCGPFSSFAMRM